MAWPDHYTVYLKELPKLEFAAQCIERDKPMGEYAIKVTQLHFFEGQPNMGNPHRMAVNGEIIIDGRNYIVTSVNTFDNFRSLKSTPEQFVFELMAGQNIPAAWRSVLPASDKSNSQT